MNQAAATVAEFIQRQLLSGHDLETAWRQGAYGVSGPMSAPCKRMLQKAMDTGSFDTDPDWQAGMRGLVETTTARSPLGQIQRAIGFRLAPPYVKFFRETLAPEASWVGEMVQIPVTEMAFDSVSLTPKKLCGIIPMTKEITRGTVAAFRSELEAALARVMGAAEGAAFLSAEAATDDQPAGVRHNVNETIGVGNPQGDIESLVAAMQDAGGDPQTAALVCSPTAALRLATVYPNADIGINGGTIAGIPVAVSQTCADQGSSDGSILALVDARGILLHDDGLGLRWTDVADITFSDSNASRVSLFALDMEALRATRWVSWEVARAGACAWTRASWGI